MRVRARGRRHTPGQMNKLEADYAKYLAENKLVGAIVSFEYEAVKLRLAKRTFYTPDFLVLRGTENFVEFHEVKGHWEDDARVKIKCAAERYPYFRFVAITRQRRAWQVEEIEP